MPRREFDPIGNFNFAVEIDGVNAAMFTECSGLESETEVIEYREGGDAAGHVRKIPGLHKVGDVTLKRGVTGSDALWEWRKNVLQGTADRKNISIILRDDSHTEVMRWNLFECWPSKFTGPSLSGKGNEVAIETLVVVCERIELAS